MKKLVKATGPFPIEKHVNIQFVYNFKKLIGARLESPWQCLYSAWNRNHHQNVCWLFKSFQGCFLSLIVLELNSVQEAFIWWALTMLKALVWFLWRIQGHKLHPQMELDMSAYISNSRGKVWPIWKLPTYSYSNNSWERALFPPLSDLSLEILQGRLWGTNCRRKGKSVHVIEVQRQVGKVV